MMPLHNFAWPKGGKSNNSFSARQLIDFNSEGNGQTFNSIKSLFKKDYTLARNLTSFYISKVFFK